jgi:lysophospholipase L1-like esterase
MKIVQIILITLTALSACTKKAQTPAKTTNTVTTSNPTTMPDSNSFTYLALGDSYTVGQSEPADVSFPVQLTSSLNSQALYVQFPTIIATTGWTTQNLIDAIAGNTSVTNKKYSFVTLLIGVNDQYQGISQSTYTANFAALLKTSINFVNGDPTRVFVLSIPDYGVTPFAQGQDSVIGPEIDQFNTINKSESVTAGVNYLDITAFKRSCYRHNFDSA